MKTYFVLCVTLFLVLAVDARRRNRPRNLSQCHRVIMSQSRGRRDCSGHSSSVRSDLSKIHRREGPPQHLQVFQRWVDDRARALDPNINFQTLVASGACTRMMCFKMMVERLVRQPNYQVPRFCEGRTGRQYKVASASISPARDWTAQDMMTVFCAKAYDPNFKFH